MEIKGILCLKKHLKPCRHITIQRPLGYNHHVFIGEVDPDWFEYFHYECSLKPCLTFSPPGQITKSRIDYSLLKDNNNINKILNFYNGGTIFIVNRVDYPQSKAAEYECIRRAKSRLWETWYSIVFNNCESYVNWIFSGDNTSNEYKNAPLLKQMSANALDGIISTGLLFAELYLIEVFCKKVPCVFENKRNAQYLDSTTDPQKGRNSLFNSENATVRNKISNGNGMAIRCVKSVCFENLNPNIRKQVAFYKCQLFARNMSSSVKHEKFRYDFSAALNKMKTTQTSSYCMHEDMTYSQFENSRLNQAECNISFLYNQQMTPFYSLSNCSTNGLIEISCANFGIFECLIHDINWLSSTIRGIFLTNFFFSCLRICNLHATRHVPNAISFECISREAFFTYAGAVGSSYGAHFIRYLFPSTGCRQQTDNSCTFDSICRNPTMSSLVTIRETFIIADDFQNNRSFHGIATDIDIIDNVWRINQDSLIEYRLNFQNQHHSLTCRSANIILSIDDMQLNTTFHRPINHPTLCIPNDQQHMIGYTFPIITALIDDFRSVAIVCIVLVIFCACIRKFVKTDQTRKNYPFFLLGILIVLLIILYLCMY